MENNRVEYKRELTADLEKEVVAFLNYPEGGTLYIGIDDNETIYGLEECDKIQLKIKDRLINNIAPSIMGLFDIIHENREGMDILRITVASGPEKPYYLKKFGMVPKGSFIRIGSSAQPMNLEMIDVLYKKRIGNSLSQIPSPRKKLTFRQLRIFYEETGYHLNENFLQNLELLTADDSFNYASYLLADENGISMKVAKYAGITRADLIENREHGNCSVLKSLYSVLDHIEAENRVFTKITFPKRKEQYMFEPRPMREAVINAVVHNDYTYSAPPKFELFSDRLEITSMGGLPEGVNQKDFFSGLSVPRNKELMRVFRDMDLVEHLGSGIPRILESYSRDVFEFGDNYFRVILPFVLGIDESGITTGKSSSTEKDSTDKSFTTGKSESEANSTTGKDISGKNTTGKSIADKDSTTGIKLSVKAVYILKACQDNPEVTIPHLAEMLKITEDGVNFHLRKLKDAGYIIRQGGRKSGYWEVLKEVKADD